MRWCTLRQRVLSRSWNPFLSFERNGPKVAENAEHAGDIEADADLEAFGDDPHEERADRSVDAPSNFTWSARLLSEAPPQVAGDGHAENRLGFEDAFEEAFEEAFDEGANEEETEEELPMFITEQRSKPPLPMPKASRGITTLKM